MNIKGILVDILTSQKAEVLELGKLVEKFQLTRDEAEDIVKGYWKV